jgi:hypothetical protein
LKVDDGVVVGYWRRRWVVIAVVDTGGERGSKLLVMGYEEVRG